MTKLSVPDMSCGHCRAAIEKAVTEADKNAQLAFDMAAREVDVASSIDNDRLLSILKMEGYPANILAS